MIFFSKIFIRIDFDLIYAIFYIVLLFIFFISIVLISTFYSALLFYTIYFLISFTFFIVAVYSLYKFITIWWKKDFAIFTKIVNSLSYGVIFAMYLYIFYAFGAVGFILCIFDIIYQISCFFIFLSFIVVMKIDMYYFCKITETWWNLQNESTKCEKIVKFLTYGLVVLLFYIFIFSLFREIWLILIFLEKISLYYYYEKKIIKFIIEEKVTNALQWICAIFINAFTFITYLRIMWEHSQSFFFFIAIIALFLLIISFYLLIVTVKFYDIADMLEFCKKYPGDAFIVLLSMVRMLGGVIGEIICMRYGTIGGFMVMGGPGMFKPSSVVVSESIKKVIGVSEYPSVIHLEPFPPIPNIPPKNVCTFVAVVANDQQGMNRSPFYHVYEAQYKIFQETNRTFYDKFPDSWEEFVSSIRSVILDAYRTGNPNLNIIITGQQVADYINAEGRFVQVKTVKGVTITTIKEALVENSETLKAIKNENMLVEIYYKEMDIDPEKVYTLREVTDAYVLKNNVRIYNVNFLPRVTEYQVKGLLDFQTNNKQLVRDCNFMLRTEGHKKCASYISFLSKGIKRGR